MVRLLALLLPVSALALQSPPAGEVRGRVVDALTGEALERVRVELAGTSHRTETSADGRFRFPPLAPAEYNLHVATVGYHLEKKPFTLAAGEAKEFEVVLTPSTHSQRETVEVTGGAFDMERQESPSVLTLSGNEARNLASVLADDPLRAIQGLGGVASNNDLQGQFSVRGADYRRVGVYLDGILLHQPFHMYQGHNEGDVTVTVFNGDMLDSMALYQGAMPVRYADRAGGVLDMQMREGNRRKTQARVTASASSASLLAEGPLGRAGKGSWLASARKSYLRYIVAAASDDTSFAFGFTDFQGHLSYDLSPKHQVSLRIVDGFSGLNRRLDQRPVGFNWVAFSHYRSTMVQAAWRATPNRRLLLTNRAAWLREQGWGANRDRLSLGGSAYGEWIWNGSGVWAWNESAPLEFGMTARRMRDDTHIWDNYYARPNVLARWTVDQSRGTGVRTGGYVQQSLGLVQGRVRATLGGRWDRHDVNDIQVATPFASLAMTPRRGTEFRLAWGQYAQFPELSQFYSIFGRPSLLPERATHYEAGLEQRLGERSRLRLELYNRQDRDLLFRSWLEPRILGGRVFDPPDYAGLRNAVRGYSRGVQVLLQRRSANGLTGWASYVYGHARLHDRRSGQRFDADQDQRHTVNVFGSRRIRPTVNVSAKWVYGSGFPAPGFLREAREQGFPYALAAERNMVRLAAYSRLDLRVNKSVVFRRWKMTYYGEVLNVLGRENWRFDSFDGYNGRTGQAFVSFEKTFPVLPVFGVALEF